MVDGEAATRISSHDLAHDPLTRTARHSQYSQWHAREAHTDTHDLAVQPVSRALACPTSPNPPRPASLVRRTHSARVGGNGRSG